MKLDKVLFAAVLLLSRQIIVLALRDVEDPISNKKPTRRLAKRGRKKKKKGKAKKKKSSQQDPPPPPPPPPLEPTHSPTGPQTFTPAPIVIVKATTSPSTASTQYPTLYQVDPKSSPPTVVKTSPPSLILSPTEIPTSSPTKDYCSDNILFECGSDRDACILADLFVSTSGCQWRRRDGWLKDPNICNWYGVVCNKFGEVERLDLYNNKLKGSLPTTMGQLVDLIDLELGTNDLTGTVPIQFGYLVGLEKLLLDDNLLTGTMPHQVCKISSLDTLWADCDGPPEVREFTCECCSHCLNKASTSPSSAPSNLCNGPEGRVIREIYNSAPSFYQEIVTRDHNWFKNDCQQQIGGVCTATNPFTGVYCSNGSVVKLALNELTSFRFAKLPKKLGNLTNLTEIIVDNKFAGSTLPSDIGMVQMKTINVQGAQLKGSFPDLSGVSSFGPTNSALLLGSNSFSGTLSDFILDSTVSEFTLRGNKNPHGFTLALNFGRRVCHSNLEVLRITSAGVHGTLPEELCSHTAPDSMKTIDFSTNSFEGNIPTLWGNHDWSTALQTVNLRKNKLSGSVNWLELDNLYDGTVNLILCDNHITGTLNNNLCNVSQNGGEIQYDSCLSPQQGVTCKACGFCT